MIGQNERFGLPVSPQFRHLVEPRLDRLAGCQVALPAISPSLAKQPEVYWISPIQTVHNVWKTRYFPTNHCPLHLLPSVRIRDFCGNPLLPFTLRPESELCVAGSAVLSLTS